MLRTFLLTLMLLFAGTARAQSYNVDSISGGDLGDIVSASSGTSVYRVTAASGAVTRQSGAAVRLGGGTANSVVTISCGSSFLCGLSTVYVTIAPSGTASGRMSNISAITVAAGSASISSSSTSGNTLVIYLNAIPRNSSRTLLVGYDVPILGNESTNATGSATAAFTVTASRVGGGGSDFLAGSVVATVIRPIAIAKVTNLQFGRVTRPTTGSGSVTLSPAGVTSVVGTGTLVLPTPAATAAQFTVTGEGGQAVTVSVPSSVTLSGSAGSVVATTSATGSGSQVLSGSTGSAGAVAVRVGGTVPLSGTSALGTLSGTLVVTVQYN